MYQGFNKPYAGQSYDVSHVHDHDMQNHGIPETKRWKYAHPEWERRFLLSVQPRGLENFAWKEIQDKYLDHSQLRLRQVIQGASRVYKLTKKVALDPDMRRKQWVTTIYLNQTEYELFSALAGTRIHKKRYTYPSAEGPPIGIDRIDLGTEVLWIAEVEFETEAEMEQYHFPLPYLREITEEAAYAGNLLAERYHSAKGAGK